MKTTTARVIQRRNVPDAIRSLSTLASPDYADLFTVHTSGAAGRSPEQWARAGIEEAAGPVANSCGASCSASALKRRPSRDHMGGWKIAERRDGWIRLEAASWFLTAQIVVWVDDAEVSVATFIRYDRPLAALVWPPLSIAHRRAMPGLLRHMARAHAAVEE